MTINELQAPCRKELFWLGIGFTILYFMFLGSHPLFSPDESRYSEVAREMLASHDFIIPHLNGSLFFHKPILFYWLQTLSLSVGGINPWSIRAIPALFGIGGILFTYWSTSLLLGRQTGRLSAIILGTTPLYFGAAHYANMDLEVAVWISFSLLSLLIGILHNKKSWLWFAYVCGGLAFLTKGLIGIFFPVAIMGLWILITHQWNLIKKLQLPLGILLLAVIILPWLILASRANPDFLHFFFLVQQLQRFSSNQFNSIQPWWFYIVLMVGGFLPWSYFFFTRLKPFYKQYYNNKIVIYLTLWVIVVLIFFSIPASKLAGYILPMFTPLAILTAMIIVEKQLSQKVFYTITGCLIMLSLIVGYSIQYLPSKNLHSTRPLIAALPQDRPPLSIVSYNFYFQDLPLYSHQIIRVVYHWQALHSDNWASELFYGQAYDPSLTQRLISFDTFWQLWQQKQPLYVFLHTKDFPSFSAQAHDAVRVIAQTEFTMVVTQK